MTANMHERLGLGFVVSAPSGGGKTTLCRRVMQALTGLEYSVSHTTRAPRGNEQHGIDYFFVTHEEFDRMIEADEFLEWAPVHKHRYGTSRAQVEAQSAQGIDLLFDIDVQGARQICAKMPDAHLIFIVPPSLAVLSERLRGRGIDSASQIETRLAAAVEEIRAASFYRYLIVNDDLERAADELRAVVVAARLAARPKGVWIDALVGAPGEGKAVAAPRPQ